MEESDAKKSVKLGRLDGLTRHGVYTGINWYADYPNHFAGSPELAKAELGKLLADMIVSNLAGDIRAVKEDDVSLHLVREFAERAAKPDADICTYK
jgi:creatinine amidohydrolase